MKTTKFLACLAVAVFTQAAFAQALSDEEVLTLGQSLKAAGDDNKTVTAKVLARGATKEQLLRIKAKQSAYSTATGSSVENSSRVNNGETIDWESLHKESDTTPTARKIFGQDIFRSKKLSFEPNTSMAIGNDYIVGPGDDLIVDIYGASQSSQKYHVSPEGTITIPRIGPIQVADMTLGAAQARIANTIGKHYQNASIKLTVGQTRTISISVMGEVKVPGSYTLSAFATVFHAIYMAGGTNEIGTLRDIKVVRNGRIISTVDVYDYILNGRLSGSVKLRDNDVIMVGSYVNLVHIDGFIKRPMWYELKKGETLSSILSYAGGFAGGAYTKSVTIKRSAGDRRSISTIDEAEFSSFTLADEDSILVRANENRFENIVTLKGAVKRPGEYGLQQILTLRELLEAAGGLDEQAIADRGVLIRLNPDRTYKSISINPQSILNGETIDIPLCNEDVITIATKANFNEDRFVRIEGDVWEPGKYPFATTMTIGDLITLAGGLQESASLMNIEVARRIIDPTANTDLDVRSKTFSFNLNRDLSLQGDIHFEIQPYDIVYVRRSPVYNTQMSVNIAGEVMFAGNYVLENQNVRLSDIVKRAGGLKRNSSAHNARLMRHMAQEEIMRQKDLKSLAERSNDSINLNIDSLSIETYSVGIDLEKAIANPGGPDDIILHNRDEIFVPLINTTVKINGEVLYPNTVTYDKKKGWRYYIQEAGGFTKESAKKKAYIVHSNGHISKAKKSKVEPGCEIIVPKKKHKTGSSDSAMKWISICTAMASTAAVVISAIKIKP